MLLCRRFADVLADACARIGGDVDCYSFTAVDFHRLDRASFAWRTATPSSQWTLTTYSLPVSRRTHSRCGPQPRAVTKFVTAIRGLQSFRYLDDFRLERLPGGIRTHWKKHLLLTAHTFAADGWTSDG